MDVSTKRLAIVGAGVLTAAGVAAIIFFKKRKDDEQEVSGDYLNYGYDDGNQEPVDCSYSYITFDEAEVIVPDDGKPDIFSIRTNDTSYKELETISADKYAFENWAHRYSYVYYKDDDILADSADNLAIVNMAGDESLIAVVKDLRDSGKEPGYFTYVANHDKLEAYEICVSDSNYLEDFFTVNGREYNAVIEEIGYSG